MAVDEGLTEAVARPELGPGEAPRTPRFGLEVLARPDTTVLPVRWDSTDTLCTIGSHPSCSLVLDDRSVSRFHAEVRADTSGVRLVDTDSTNGSVVDGVRVSGAFLRDGSVIEL